MSPASESAMTPGGRRSGAESSRKMLRVLFAFDAKRHTRTAAEIAEFAEIPASTAYRYLGVLREEGLVEEAGRGCFRLSLRFAGLSDAALAPVARLIKAARPVLHDIATRSGETTLLVRRQGSVAVCVDRVESRHPVRLQFDAGAPMNLHQGSAARVLLAGLPRAQRREYLTAQAVRPSGPLSDAALDALAELGWAESFEEVDGGIWGAAAAITEGGAVQTAIGLAGPLYRLTESKRRRALSMIRGGATRITAELTAKP